MLLEQKKNIKTYFHFPQTMLQFQFNFNEKLSWVSALKVLIQHCSFAFYSIISKNKKSCWLSYFPFSEKMEAPYYCWIEKFLCYFILHINLLIQKTYQVLSLVELWHACIIYVVKTCFNFPLSYPGKMFFVCLETYMYEPTYVSLRNFLSF